MLRHPPFVVSAVLLLTLLTLLTLLRDSGISTTRRSRVLWNRRVAEIPESGDIAGRRTMIG
jgi:hypothetical protein